MKRQISVLDPAPIGAAGDLLNPYAKRRRWSAVIGAIGTALAGLLFLMSPLGDGLTELSYDLAFLFRHDVKPAEVVMVYMDWDSHVRLGQEQFRRWERTLHARLLDRLREMGARTVVFDIVFLPTTNSAAEDKELVRAARAHGRVVVAALVTPDVQDGQVVGWKLTKPFPELEAAAAWGVAEVGDENKSVRQHYYRRDYEAPSLAWRAAQLTLTNPPPNPFRDRWLNFYGPPGIFMHYSFWEVLATNALPATAFSNKVVFVGSLYDIGMTGGKGTDDFRTPYTRWTGRRSPGAEINATAYLNLLRGDWLNRLPAPAEAGLIVLIGGMAGFALARCRPVGATVLGGTGFLMVATAAIFFACQKEVWFPWMIAGAVQLPCALGWALFSHSRWLASENKLLTTQMAPAGAMGAEVKPESRPLALNQAEAARAEGQVLGRNADGNRRPDLPALPVAAGKGSPAVPDHELLRCIGRGAYGEVWLARNVIGTYHAVKIVYRRRFENELPYEREFNGIKKFMPISRNHAGLIHVLHVGRNHDEGYIYYVMEAADDEVSREKIAPDSYSPKTLARELKRRQRLPMAECVRLGVDLAAALDFLHQQQLIHRDIKPSNILFVNGAPKLADIGLVTDVARQIGDVSYLGTKGYIPPEGPGTAAGDVYSLGKVLYEASTGLEVGCFPDLPTALAQQPKEDPFYLLNAILLKACENSAELRYTSAALLHEALVRLNHKLAEQAASQHEH
jgi:CHASE2 domain-containing sensor protein